MAQASAGVADAAAGQVNEVNGGVPNEANGVPPVVANAPAAVLGAPVAVVAVPAAAVVAAGQIMANLEAVLIPVPTFSIGAVLLGPLPTKSNISCEIHAWIDEEGP